jgi:hypothetical protein
VSIKAVGKKKVYDISVADSAHYLLKNGVVSHNTGIYYSSDTIWIIGRQQDKDGDEMKGYHFIINIEKSRFVREKSKIPISVSWEGGIERNSGLLDVAIEGGYVNKPQVGWYVAHDPKTKKDLSKKLRADQTFDDSFWNTIYEKTDFKDYVKNRYAMGHVEMLASRKTAEIEEDAD